MRSAMSYRMVETVRGWYNIRVGERKVCVLRYAFLVADVGELPKAVCPIWGRLELTG